MSFRYHRGFDNERATLTLGTGKKEITVPGVILSMDVAIYGNELHGYWLKTGSNTLSYFTTADQALKHAKVATNDPATLLRLAALQSDDNAQENI